MIDSRPLFVPFSPKGVDYALWDIQNGLIDCFGKQNEGVEGKEYHFLDKCYGKAERRQRQKDKRSVFYPSFAVGAEYENLFPDTVIGNNYIWFDVLDPVAPIDPFRRYQTNKFEAQVGLVFWFNYRYLYPETYKSQTVENVKDLFITFFTFARFRVANVTLLNIEERVENVFRGYTHNELDTQYLMRPYGAIRVNLRVIWDECCCPPHTYEYFKK